MECRAAAIKAFSAFLQDETLRSQQIRFIELIVDQLTARGVMTLAALYEPPFKDLNIGGPDAVFVGRETVVDEIFVALAEAQRCVA